MRPLTLLVAVGAAAAVSTASGAVGAHAIGLSRGDYALAGDAVSATLTLARGDAELLVPELDANGDSELSPAELASGRDAVAGALLGRLRVASADGPCAPKLERVELTEGDGLSASGSFRCANRAAQVDVDLGPLFAALPRGHRHLAHARGTAAAPRAMYEGDARLVLTSQGEAAAKTPMTAPEARSSTGLLSFVRMGIEHILTGYDHLLFLLGLVVVGASWRSLAKVVSAFTVAHSMTLAVAAFGLWTPPARIVEPMIALSIAYVGMENLLSRDQSRRWRLTFAFGLVHGFGFASALREVAPGGGGAALALLGFNLGVEAGQLAVIGLVLPLVVLLRRAHFLDGARARVPSLGIAAAGAIWFVARLV